MSESVVIVGWVETRSFEDGHNASVACKLPRAYHTTTSIFKLRLQPARVPRSTAGLGRGPLNSKQKFEETRTLAKSI